MLRSYLFSLLILTFVFSASAQKKKGRWKEMMGSIDNDTTSEDYYGSQTLRYEDYVYQKNIKTILFHNESFELSQPMLSLGSDEKFKVSFDDLDADLKSYSYTLIHCNSNWEPSDLSPSEFIDGFIDNNINDHQYSYNTLQKYTHYNFTFPNGSLRITKTGNYILKVYANSNPDDLVFTRRFLIFENRVAVNARVQQASIIEDRNYKQEIDFTINHNDYAINNPYNDLHIVMMQNNRWDNMRTGFKPQFIKDKELVYDYDDLNVFNGGNEFRYFDIKSFYFKTQYVYKYYKDSAGNHADLYNEEKRSFKRYSTYTDMNGKYLVKIQEGRNSEIEADYCYVNFFLPYDDPTMDGNIYIYGALNDWKCNQTSLMHYNAKRFGYECTLYLKQGFYNYEYVFMKDGETAGDETLIEGSHYETENDYLILIYHRRQGTFYDQLIGVKRVNSIREY